jgi:hypothetical protein
MPKWFTMKETIMPEIQETRSSQQQTGQSHQVTTFKVTQLIWLLLGILEGVLALRFLFKLIGVNAANSFASFLYNLTDFFVKPFETLIGTPAAGAMVFEIFTVIAMLVYALAFWALERLVYLIFYRPRGPVVAVSQTSTTGRKDSTGGMK